MGLETHATLRPGIAGLYEATSFLETDENFIPFPTAPTFLFGVRLPPRPCSSLASSSRASP